MRIKIHRVRITIHHPVAFIALVLLWGICAPSTVALIATLLHIGGYEPPSATEVRIAMLSFVCMVASGFLALGLGYLQAMISKRG